MTDSISLTSGTRLIPQPNGVFAYNLAKNFFHVFNNTGRDLLLDLALGRASSSEDLIHTLKEAWPEQPMERLTADTFLFLKKAESLAVVEVSDAPSTSEHSESPVVEYLEKQNYLKLVYAVVDITIRCNGSCRYCYAEANSSKDELPGDDWIDILSRLKTGGLRAITISGGEPLLHADSEAIIRYCGENFILELNTNGAFVTDDFARILASLDLKCVQVSLDSLDPAENDRMRYRGAFDHAMNALELLDRHRVPVRISATFGDQSSDSIQRLRDWIQQKGYAANLRNMRRAGRAERLRDFDWSSVPSFAELNPGRSSECAAFEVPCTSMVGFGAINHDGRLKACTMPESFFGRIGGGIEPKDTRPTEFKETQMGMALQVAIEQASQSEQYLTGGLCPMASTLSRGVTIW